MGLIGKLVGGPDAVTALGEAAKGVAEVFTPSATKRMELSAAVQQAALREFADEFGSQPTGWFDRAVNGINRLPRPLLAFGTIGLFVYAMVDPQQFALRMVGLNAVPEPLWWLLGAVVAFYFGSRESYYFRNRAVTMPAGLAVGTSQAGVGSGGAVDDNPALDDWRNGGN
jgi:hypothetical protein